MSWQSIQYRIKAGRGDRARDEEIPIPKGVTQCCDISYGPHGKSNLLDVYYPDSTTGPLATIVSFHGGGYVYGSKEIYKRYCMDLARRGFAVVNYNYRLAPRWKFPAPIEDTNLVFQWVLDHGKEYHADAQRLVLVGDSAGAQMACQYAAIATNPEFARLYKLTVPPVPIRALGLNCGRYDLKERVSEVLGPRHQDFWGKKVDTSDPIYDVMAAITESFPPTYLATSYYDGLKKYAQPMYEFLLSKNIRCAGRVYGSVDERFVSHDFQLDISLTHANQCNDDECEFFRQYV